jgi:hypothetical protein
VKSGGLGAGLLKLASEKERNGRDRTQTRSQRRDLILALKGGNQRSAQRRNKEINGYQKARAGLFVFLHLFPRRVSGCSPGDETEPDGRSDASGGDVS